MSFFDSLKKMFVNQNRETTAGAEQSATPAGSSSVPEPADHTIESRDRAWEDRSRTPEQRLLAYSAHIARELTRHNAALETLPADEANVMRESDDYQWLLQESQAILSGELTPIKFCIRMDTLAQVILDSFHIDREGFVHLTIPAGVSDLEAIEALCGYFERKNPNFGHRGFDESQLEWYVTHGGAGTRDLSSSREIAIIPVVEGTKEQFRDEQERVLKSKGLTWVPEIEIALVGLAYCCIGESTGSLSERNRLLPNIFESKWLRGASLTNGVMLFPNTGVMAKKMLDHTPAPFWAASGKKA